MRRFLILGLFTAALTFPAAQQAAAAPASCQELTPSAVAAFFDGKVPTALGRDHVPGAVVSVTAAGKPLFAKGYGLADVEHGVAFDPQRSLVRIASITKLFTWTAVMQQVEAGKLDLNADVNTYLKTFKIPGTYPQPVTLLTLMEHTSGFEDRVVGVGARSADDVPPLGEFLAANMPARIRPPGEVSAYSNYGAALAGYIVSLVSGEPYDQYVQKHIFDPLRMSHSTATEPVPAALAGDLARSYGDGGRLVPFTFDPLAPDGSISTTAADMANFMIAHLDNGASILRPPTAATMHQTPSAGIWAHGFTYRIMNGHRVLMHDGGWEAFNSAMILVPGCDLGLFVSTNSYGGGEAMSDLIPAFFDRFAPTPDVPDTMPTPALTTPQAGFYQPTRHNESTVEKITNLLGPARLSVGGDGTVHFGGKDWRPQPDGRYGLADGSDHLAFRVGTAGRRYIVTDRTAYELMHASETPMVNLVVLLLFVVPALSVLVLPFAALRRRPRSTTWRAARWLAASAALLGVGFLVGLTAVLLGDTSEFLYGVPLYFTLLLAAPVVVLGLSGGAVGCTISGWRRSGAGIVARVHQVGLLVGLAALAWFLWQWNLIGWQY
jgi:CubicO group peptidase (beta-lactamase class C family)